MLPFMNKGSGSPVKRILSSYPTLFFPLYRAFGPEDRKPMLVSKDTRIVIEGFPRSANTFAFFAFQVAQNKTICIAHNSTIAHHIHSEAQILEGVRRSLPVIALIRNPVEAIKSYKLALTTLDDRVMLNRWLDFYRSVRTVQDNVVIADFPTVTRDFGAVIRRVNEKYSTSFGVFEHSQSNLTQVDSYIDRANERTKELYGTTDMLLARPTDEKERNSRYLKLKLDQKVIGKALQLYDELTGK